MLHNQTHTDMKTLELKNATGNTQNINPSEWSNCYDFQKAYSEAYSNLAVELDEIHPELDDSEFNDLFNKEYKKLIQVKGFISTKSGDDNDVRFNGIVIEYDDSRISYNTNN